MLKRFLGDDWAARHFGTEEHPFFVGFHAPTFEQGAKWRRIYELADMLLNLQNVEGFQNALEKLRDDSVETGFAAMEAAKVLFRSRVRFRFVIPSGITGCDYDFEAFPDDGLPVAIEAKSRLETISMAPARIKESLDAARKQLPSGGRGIIFLRVPREWASEGYLNTPFAEAAFSLLRNSSRVAGILICSHQLIDMPHPVKAETKQGKIMVVREFWSKRPEFADAPKWGLCRSIIGDDKDWISVSRLLGEHLSPFQLELARRTEAWKAEQGIP